MPFVPLDVEAVVARYPCLYHMAERGSWPSIQRRGLLSTRALVELFEVPDEQRTAILSRRRPRSVPIGHPEHGSALIRDQIPLSESALQHCLDGATPREWYEILNGLVFFWLDNKRLEGLLGARAYRGRQHTVITVDTAALLARHADRTYLSPINSGSTAYKPARRGRDTFVRLRQYPEEWWTKRRVAELAVEYGVPDIADLTVSVEEWQDGQMVQAIWER